jgi:hypothetical protein
MGQPGAVVVAFMRNKDLRLVLEAPESGRMDDAVAIALEIGTCRGLGFGIEPPARLRGDSPRSSRPDDAIGYRQPLHGSAFTLHH